MLKNYLKMALRNMLRAKMFTAINIVGLAVSIAFFLLTAIYIINEYNYDTFNIKYKRIYKLIDSKGNSGILDYKIADNIKNNFQETEDACTFQMLNSPVDIICNGTPYSFSNIMSVDDSYFKMFTVEVMPGSPKKLLENINSVVLTESTAGILFGTCNPIGKTINYDHKIDLIVSAVIKDMPNNSSSKPTMVVNSDNDLFKFTTMMGVDNGRPYSRNPVNIFVLLKEDIPQQIFVNKINNYVNNVSDYIACFDLIPLKDLYLHDNSIGSSSLKGNYDLVRLLGVISLVIILLAIFNYNNITLSLQHMRSKELFIRKTIGANEKNIILQFLIESTIIVFISFLIAIFVVKTMISFYGDIVNCNLEMSDIYKYPINVIIIIAFIIISMFSGFIPAFIYSQLNPTKIHHMYKSVDRKKISFSKVLIVSQYTIAIMLIFSLLIIIKQINYINNSDTGFNKKQLLKIKLPRSNTSTHLNPETFVNMIKEKTKLSKISISYGAPGEKGLFLGKEINNKLIRFAPIFADSALINTCDMKIVEGRNAYPSEMGKVCIINEAAKKELGWNRIENKKLDIWGENDLNVVGVVKNFHNSSFKRPIDPVVIIFNRDYQRNINIRLDAKSEYDDMNTIKSLWKKWAPDYQLDYCFVDEVLASQYTEEMRLAKTIGLFSISSVVICCLGVLGLAIHTSERKTKEIGIRKVFGAKSSNIMYLLNRQLLRAIITALIIAYPLSSYLLNKWLSNYAYHVSINIWDYLLAGIIALIIAFISAGWHTWKLSNKNTIEIIKYE